MYPFCASLRRHRSKHLHRKHVSSSRIRVASRPCAVLGVLYRGSTHGVIRCGDSRGVSEEAAALGAVVGLVLASPTLSSNKLLRVTCGPAVLEQVSWSRSPLGGNLESGNGLHRDAALP